MALVVQIIIRVDGFYECAECQKSNEIGLIGGKGERGRKCRVGVLEMARGCTIMFRIGGFCKCGVVKSLVRGGRRRKKRRGRGTLVRREACTCVCARVRMHC